MKSFESCAYENFRIQISISKVGPSFWNNGQLFGVKLTVNILSGLKFLCKLFSEKATNKSKTNINQWKKFSLEYKILENPLRGFS